MIEFKIKNRLLIVFALVCSLLGITGCGQSAFMTNMAGMHGGGLPVQSVTLHSESVDQSDVYQATLISRYSTSLKPQVAGQIANIYVKAGDHVKSGQLLMLIDKRKQEATLNSSRADAASSKAAIDQAKNMLDNYLIQREALESSLIYNKKLYDRYNALYAKKSVSQQDLEKYTDGYIKAKADLASNTVQIQAQKAVIMSSKSNYAKALADINVQEAELQYYKITSPYSGIIGDIPVKTGGYVTSSTQLLSITQNDTLEINVGLPAEKVFNIHIGLPVEVLDNNGKIMNKSKTFFVSPKIDTDTQTVLVKALLYNKTGIFKADQSVKAKVIYKQAPGILAPTSGIGHFGGLDYVYLINKKNNNSFVKQQPVKLGEIQDNKYVVLSGLKDGDQIVSQGIQKLMDGAPVTILSKE